MTEDNVTEATRHLNKIFKRVLRDAKKRAERKGIVFDLDYEFLRSLYFHQNGTCFYTGRDFKRKGHSALSLDRIDSSKGYTRENVVWCRVDVNSMKNSKKYEEVLELCKDFFFHKPKFKALEKFHD